MNGVIGCIDLAQKAETKSETDEILEAGHCSAHNLQHLLDNVLLYSEALSGTLKPDPQTTNMNNWLEDILSPFNTSALKHDLAFEKYISPELPAYLEIDGKNICPPFQNNPKSFNHLTQKIKRY